MRKQQGFTLVEIAIVLVIIGLLLGGILRGQELIQGARVRNVIDQQNGVRAAFFAFQDRFRLIPGSIPAAQINLVGSNALASSAATAGNGTIATTDSTTAFQNLTATGFLSCSVCTVGSVASTSANSPSNVYGGVMQLVTDLEMANITTAVAAPTSTLTSTRTNVKTGNLIPSNVMGEIDLKADDGNPFTGNVRFSRWAGSAPLLGIASCTSNANPGSTWNNGQSAAQAISGNCGGGTIIN